MRDLHRSIAYRDPESLIGAIIFEALEKSTEISIKKVSELEAILILENTEESEKFINSLTYKFELMSFFYSTNQNSSKDKRKTKFIELHIHTSQNYFYKFNYYLTGEFHEFDEIIKKVSTELNISDHKTVKKKIDNFLVEIDFLPEYNTDPCFSDMDREWDIEYNKVVLALHLFDDEETFILFSKYVYHSIAYMFFSRQEAQLIWKNKSLWLEKYESN